MFQLLRQMMVYSPRTSWHGVRSLLLLRALFAIASCGRSVPTATATSGSPPLPPGLQNIFNIPGAADTFTIKVYIIGQPNPVVVDNVRLSADKSRIENFHVRLPKGRLDLRSGVLDQGMGKRHRHRTD